MPALIIDFGILIVFMVLYGLGAAAQVLTGSSQANEQGGLRGWLNVLEKAALLLPALVFHVANKALSGVISRWAAAHLLPVTRWVNALAQLVRDVAVAQARFAAETAIAVERIVTHTIPARTAAVAHTAAAATKAVARTAAKAEHEATATAKRLARFTATETAKVRRLTHTVDVTLPKAIRGLRAGERTLSRDYTNLKRRVGAVEDGAVKTFDYLRRHPFGAAMGVFTGVVSIALAKLGYGFMRCRSWQNLGRSLKCSDANLLGELLADATLALGVVSLVELAREEQQVIGDLAGIVRRAWDVA